MPQRRFSFLHVALGCAGAMVLAAGCGSSTIIGFGASTSAGSGGSGGDDSGNGGGILSTASVTVASTTVQTASSSASSMQVSSSSGVGGAGGAPGTGGQGGDGGTAFCGDGDITGDEDCDGQSLGGADCSDFGYVASAGLACDQCNFDTSGCTNVCGNSVIEPGEGCDDGDDTDPNDGCHQCVLGGTTCNDAIVVDMDVGRVNFVGSTDGGGQHATQQCDGEQNSPDRVYAVTPKSDGFLTAALLRDETPFDSMLYALTDCQNTASGIACEDNYGGSSDDGGETISFRVSGGTTYYVIVDGWGGQQGKYELELDLSLGTCADPVHFPLWDGQGQTAVGSTTGMGLNHFALCGGNTSPDVVYEIVPQFDGDMSFSARQNGTNFDSLVTIRSSCSGALDELDCDHDAGGNDTVTATATNGTALYGWIDGFGVTGSDGEYTLRIRSE